MNWYAERIFPRVLNIACNSAVHRKIRARVCAGLAGDVVEIGFGTGLNLPHLPPEVRRVRAVDPSRLGTRIASKRMAASHAEVELAALDGQHLPFPDASADAALSTWTLCTIPDPVAALQELRRVLRPGGQLHFVEHGLAPDPSVQRWQHRLDGLQQRLAAGCHLDRDISALFDEAGMTVDRLERYYGPGEPRFIAALYEGTARA